jgi:hypothetical protein
MEATTAAKITVALDDDLGGGDRSPPASSRGITPPRETGDAGLHR